jgi:hypothetical protein
VPLDPLFLGIGRTVADDGGWSARSEVVLAG